MNIARVLILVAAALSLCACEAPSSVSAAPAGDAADLPSPTTVAPEPPPETPAEPTTASAIPVDGPPSDATGLGDLDTLTGVRRLGPADIAAEIDEHRLYESGGQVRARLRGTLTNLTEKLITAGEVRFTAEVGFEDGCPVPIAGTKSLAALGVGPRTPWRPGETLEFLVTSDSTLPAITTELPASEVTWTTRVYAEDPVCWRAHGTVDERPGSWLFAGDDDRAATVEVASVPAAP